MGETDSHPSEDFCWPVVRTNLRKVFGEVVDLDDPKVWASVIRERAELFRKEMPIASDNLAIAQHRDTLRYATLAAVSTFQSSKDSPLEI